jgi:hypothetical protein
LPLSTRIIGALSFCKVTQQTMDDAMFIQKKIHGCRAKAKKTPTPDQIAIGEGKSISVSQQSYDNIVDHLSSFRVLLKAEPLYTPNEPELQVAALDYLYTEMNDKNTYAKNAANDFGKMLGYRNQVFYGHRHGSKGYVRNTFGSLSVEYKQINVLKFVDLRSRKSKKKADV